MAGPLFAISLILVLSGALKVVSPESASNALSTLGFPVPEIGVRVLGVGEMALGVAGLVVAGAVVALLVAVAYSAFAVVAEVLRHHSKRGSEAGGGVASCGCFGRNDTPPSILHTAVNVVAAVVGFAAVLWPADEVSTVLAAQPAAGVPFAALVLLGAYLLFLSFTALPRVFAPPAADVPTFAVTNDLQRSES